MSQQATALQKQLYNVAIFEEEIVLSDFTDGAERRFLVDREQLMGFFQSEVTFRPLPGLIWMKTDGSRTRYLFVIRGRRRTILYRRKKKTEPFEVHFPSIAALAVVAERKIEHLDLWAFAGSSLTDESILYELPLPNLGGSRVCLGSTEKQVEGDDVLGAVERIVFDAPYNHHGDRVGVEEVRFYEYHAKHGGRCPLRTLKRIGRGRDILEERP